MTFKARLKELEKQLGQEEKEYEEHLKETCELCTEIPQGTGICLVGLNLALLEESTRSSLDELKEVIKTLEDKVKEIENYNKNFLEKLEDPYTKKKMQEKAIVEIFLLEGVIG